MRLDSRGCILAGVVVRKVAILKLCGKTGRVGTIPAVTAHDGITSAAVDGIRVAEAICARYAPVH